MHNANTVLLVLSRLDFEAAVVKAVDLQPVNVGWSPTVTLSVA